jgi:16S rRNA (cytosine967-C5)-methyltransferase
VSDPRRLAIEAVRRIESEGAYANLVVPALLDRSDLDERDRHFVTELAYGATRMRRSCDWLVDRYLLRPVDPEVRAALRIGAYQLAFLGTPPHAAVDATVGAMPRKARGFVNAVLRKVAAAPADWPDEATRLSYPDWIIDRLVTDLGTDSAVAALEAMNRPATVTTRADGYRQDPASTLVAGLVGAGPGDRVADLCAAPGGKATALAATGAFVVAADVRPGRLGLVVANRDGLGASNLVVVAADGTRPPLRPGAFDAVLVDAPCSGLGALRRRPDARWRIEADAPERLAALQVELVTTAASLVRPGGTLVYSVCTITDAESTGVDAAVAARGLGLEPVGPLGGPWTPHGRGGRLLPQDIDSDGMAAFVYRVGPAGSR